MTSLQINSIILCVLVMATIIITYEPKQNKKYKEQVQHKEQTQHNIKYAEYGYPTLVFLKDKIYVVGEDFTATPIEQIKWKSISEHKP